MRNDILSRELQDMVEKELETGEKIVWIGMPVPKFFIPKATGTFIFGIPWTAFAIFWTVTASWGVFQSGNANIFWLFPLFGIPFIVVGIGMLLSPVFAYKKALKTVYVITDKRAITFDYIWSREIRSYPPNKLQEIYRKENSDGTGDVIISCRNWKDSDGDRQSEELGFIHIEAPKNAEQMLKKLAKEAVAENSDKQI